MGAREAAGTVSMPRARDELSEYRRKRDFARTPEPAAGGGRRKLVPGGRQYVIQKHAARRLHFDFRLELDGVLKSWAVTRGPSLDPGDKRLAVRTEDHPLDYGDFEGTIPEGEYGGGAVMVWDRGQWEPLGDPRKDLDEGKLKFRLKGARLQGAWALIRMRTREKKENWLLIKERDEFVDPDADLPRRWETSVKTGRDMGEIASGVDRSVDQEPSGKYPLLAFVPPLLATPAEVVPEGEGWLHEIKYDGYRAIVALAGGAVRFYTRSGLDWTDRFRALAPEFRTIPVDEAIVDGEVVVLDAAGRSSFGALQDALAEGGELRFFAFDLLRLDGKDLRKLPLVQRKETLAEVLGRTPRDLVRFCDHVAGGGTDFYAAACRHGLEGVISKRADSRYRSGRTGSWLKVKCTRREEVVIAGYRKSTAAGRPFASLVAGTFEDGTLVYRGRIGTGFDARILADLAARFRPLVRKKTPFQTIPKEATRDVVWLEPHLVAEVNYTERTSDGVMRHPVYLGLREDKPAREVQAERPNPASSGRDAKKDPLAILTHPEKVLYPKQGLTKRALAEYLLGVQDLMMPHLEGRLLTLVRCPQGRTSKCFYQRHWMQGMPASFVAVPLPDEEDKADFVRIDERAPLVGVIQFGVLELHLWGSRFETLDRPDRLVFDLDPDDSVPYAQVVDAAREMKDILASAGIESFPMVTGGKGIHVVAPVLPKRPWKEVNTFCRGLAYAMSAAAPERYLAKASKSERKGRIFVDWMRNQRTATAIAPFSTRARDEAPVATPVTWRELPRLDTAAAFTVKTLPRRLQRLRSDPWEGYFELAQEIPQGALDLFRDKSGSD